MSSLMSEKPHDLLNDLTETDLTKTSLTETVDSIQFVRSSYLFIYSMIRLIIYKKILHPGLVTHV